jgi:hypothetical protein
MVRTAVRTVRAEVAMTPMRLRFPTRRMVQWHERPESVRVKAHTLDRGKYFSRDDIVVTAYQGVLILRVGHGQRGRYVWLARGEALRLARVLRREARTIYISDPFYGGHVISRSGVKLPRARRG